MTNFSALLLKKSRIVVKLLYDNIMNTTDARSDGLCCRAFPSPSTCFDKLSTSAQGAGRAFRSYSSPPLADAGYPLQSLTRYDVAF